jgi:hypothetical protein
LFWYAQNAADLGAAASTFPSLPLELTQTATRGDAFIK